jgi:hypothetical protein
MGGAALMEETDGLAELEPASRPDQTRAALSAMAVLTVLLLIGGLVSAVVVDRRSGPVSIATLRSAADRVAHARSLHMSMDASFVVGDQPTAGFHMTVDVDNVTNQGKFQVNGNGRDLNVVFDGTTAYVNTPTGGKACAVVDLAATAAAMPGAPTGTDGKALLGYLAGASGTVRDLGTEKVGSVETHKYGVDVDVAQLTSRLPNEQRAAATAFLQTTGPQTIPYVVWVDGDDMVRQVSIEFLAGGIKATTTMRFDPSDKPVTVDIPAAGTCAPVADLNSIMGGG